MEQNGGGRSVRGTQKRVFCALLALAFLLGSGCARDGGSRVAAAPEVIDFVMQPTPTPLRPTESPAPTPTPTPIPTPTPSPMPTVDADWYRQRDDMLRTLLPQNGAFENAEAVEEAISGMGVDPNRPMIALTFDDGPKAGVTEGVLDVLEEYGVRATFFVCGWRIKPGNEQAAALLRRMVSLGCEIGNHTTNHINMKEASYNKLYYEVEATNDRVFDATGYTPRTLRPPGGRIGFYTSGVARKLDMAVALWAQSGNVMETDPQKIAQNVFCQIVNGKELEDGDIVLLHDTHPEMIEAVKIMVPKLLEQGYQLVTVWELINCSERGFLPGETYRRQRASD